MMESLLRVIQWPSSELEHIRFVTRAVRVIDLVTNLEMASFQTNSGNIDIHTEAAAGNGPLQKTPTVRDTGTIKYQQNFSASLRSYSAVVGPNVPSPVYNGHVEHLIF